jgi:peptidoglycan/xylan/chitin deacetylase (PgdA/CDA1 family)
LRRLVLSAILVTFSFLAHAEVSFAGLDLAPTNKLLFTATTEAPGWGEYTTLFLADLAAAGDATASTERVAGGDTLRNVPIAQLTHFPEVLSYLPELGAVQIQNRFGLFRGRASDGEFEPVAGFDHFSAGGEVPSGRIIPTVSSPNGRYLIVLDPDSSSFGKVILIDTTSGDRLLVSDRVELSTAGPPAAWSPDSRFFVYASEGDLFYYSIEQMRNGRLLGEGYRRIGGGTLANVRWSPDSSLYYVTGSLVYQILGAEFFARSLYSGLIGAGTIVGKIPFPFDPSFDSFWVAPDGDTALLNKGGRNLFVLFLNTDDFVDEGQILTLPSLFMPRNTRVRTVLWSESNKVTVLAGSIESGESGSTVFRLSIDSNSSTMSFVRTDDAQVGEIALSRDERLVALVTDEAVVIRNYESWQQLRSFSFVNPLHAVWIDDERFVVGSGSTVELVSAVSGPNTILTLAQADSHLFSDSGDVIVGAAGRVFVYDGGWEENGEMPVRRLRVASNEYRVYTESLSSGNYRNVVMVRRARGVGTSRLFAVPTHAYEPFPSTDESVDLSYFSHGSRIRRREISFVFNAVDSVEGLTEILTTLAAYDVTATFFINGEFIRRHPTALKEIAEAGHEIGSLFFSYFDMADRRYLITEDFIREGLARNEDDYFEATGNELSLLWHAPYYFINDTIISAGRSANYIYVGRDVDSLDWVPRRTDEGLSQLYLPAGDLVQRILDVKRPGSIVSMQVGIPDAARGGRDDYLFQKLDVLINGLLDSGYDVVPVSTLLENAQ